MSIKKYVESIPVGPLAIVALSGSKQLGEAVDAYIADWRSQRIEAKESPITFKGYTKDSYLLDVKTPRFGTGEAKCTLGESVRGTDLYIIYDVTNYSFEYTVCGCKNHMSPDDHFADIKRVIAAAAGKARKITVIMPFLYEGRQHRRTSRESMDCAVMLQELVNMGVDNILTFDAHDPRVQNAVPLMGLDNIIPSYQVLKAMFKNLSDFRPDKDHFMIISPDEGAINRNMYYASVLGVNLGMFYKRRDYSTIIDGRNPIVAHEYMGNDVAGKDVFIADDIISSGESMLDIAVELKKRKANKIYCYATYPIFTNGLESFNKAYADGIIDGVFGTNLTYRTPELHSSPWLYEEDCSKYIAYFIASLNHDKSISQVIDPHTKIEALLKKYGIK